MSIPKKLERWLAEKKIKYQPLAHKTVYTAFDLARTAKAKAEQVVKSVLVKVDGRYLVVAIPAHYKLDFDKIRKAVKAKKISMAKERIMKDKLKIVPGTITPFTAIYPKLEGLGAKAKTEAGNIPVYVDRALLKSKDLLLAAGSFQDAMKIRTKDFMKNVQAQAGQFGKRDSHKVIIEAKKKLHRAGKKGRKIIRKTARKTRRAVNQIQKRKK